MGQSMENEGAEAWAQDALAWMSDRDIVPTPDNFELIYTYLGAQDPDLKQVLDGLVERGCKFEPSVMANLHQRFFRTPLDETIVADVSEKIAGELDSVLQMLESAGRDQSNYGHTLSVASGALKSAAPDGPNVEKVIEKLVTATRTMEAHSKQLEQQLQCSSREINDLHEKLELITQEALTDQLTGINNRKAFDAELDAAIEQATDTNEPLCLVMVDIDYFKKFNDTWGHQTGDQVLRLVAACLSENVKGRDTAARYGGEEFAVVLPQTNLVGATLLADQIRGKVESKKLVKKSTGDILGVITISAGIAQLKPGEDAAEFIKRADACLYAAKHAGRNRVVNETQPGVVFRNNVAA